MPEPVSEDDFARMLRTFRRSAFRLETQDAYALSYERADFEAFLAGTPLSPQIGWFRDWLDQVAAQTRAGKSVSRVRVLAEPPTDYQRWTLSGTRWYEAAGDIIRYMPRSQAVAIDLPMGTDWWLLDDERLILMHFTSNGEVSGKELVTDPGIIARYRHWQDLAVRNATTADEIAA